MSTDGAPVTEGNRGRGWGAGGCGRNNTPSFGKSDDCMIWYSVMQILQAHVQYADTRTYEAVFMMLLSLQTSCCQQKMGRESGHVTLLLI